MTPISDTARRLSRDEWIETYLRHATGEDDGLIPFPPDDIQKITNSQKGLATARYAVDVFDCLEGVFRSVGPVRPEQTVLDYGCGWGRIARLLPFLFDDENIHGVDVDKRLVEAAQACLPSINFRAISSMHALPFDDGSFDFVFANSVFSHLSEECAVFTLRELARVTRKGGVVVVSVLEKQDMDKFYRNNAEQERWITGILGSHEHATRTLAQHGFVWGPTRRWEHYGIAVMDEAWISARFGELGLALVRSERTKDRGSQNYKVGLRH